MRAACSVCVQRVVRACSVSVRGARRDREAALTTIAKQLASDDVRAVRVPVLPFQACIAARTNLPVSLLTLFFPLVSPLSSLPSLTSRPASLRAGGGRSVRPGAHQHGRRGHGAGGRACQPVVGALAWARGADMAQ